MREYPVRCKNLDSPHPLPNPESLVDKQFNRDLARRRVAVEHVNRRLKIFRIFSQRYRNRRKRFALRCHLIAGVYNYDIQNAC
ncbi:transposase family protein [Nostoc sp.]|uniref:transposase family protein n=1 Tax=Nostoc sp. TaxID=1180 RepID=UPI002FFC3348